MVVGALRQVSRWIYGCRRLIPQPLLARMARVRDFQRDLRLRAGWEAQLTEAAMAISEECLQPVPSLADWQASRPELKRQVLWMLGLDPPPQRSPLCPRIVGSIEREKYVVEKVVFESLPGMLVTGNFYLPKGRSAPVPCVLYLCGHQIHPLGAKTQYQDRFLWYPEHGFACLVLDPVQCGEIQGIHRGTHSMGMWSWLSLGYTPAGIEVWNGMRALDWLEARPEVDGERIGATGVSGGGVMTWFLAATDDRIRVAAPSSSTYTLGSQVVRGLVSSQCDCTFYPNVFHMDFPEVGALVAPRPLLILGGKKDRIFPPVGYQEAYRKVRGIYGLYHPAGEMAESRIRLTECNDGHSDSAESLREVREWMVRWLNSGDERQLAAVDRPAPPAEAAERLVCYEDLPSGLANFTVHEHFVRGRPPVAQPSLPAWEARRKELMESLRSRVFGWFPDAPCAFQSSRILGSGGHAQRFARFSEWAFDSEAGAQVRVQLFEPKAAVPDCRLLVVVKRTEDQLDFPDDQLLPLFKRHRVLILVPRFVRWNPTQAENAATQRAAALSGRSFAALQVWDTIRTVCWAQDEMRLEASKISVFGRGTAGIVALYAALFEERISQVILDTPPASHRDGPSLPTILRETDIPEVAGAFAPRELTMLGKPPAAFALTRGIYDLFGNDGRYWCADSAYGAVCQGARRRPQTGPLRESPGGN